MEAIRVAMKKRRRKEADSWMNTMPRLTVPTAAFQACSRLKTVRLGSGTELVSDYAFGNCPLEHLYVEAVYPPVCNPDAFSTSQGNLFRTCTLHVPANSMDRYKAHPSWGQFEHIMEIE